ncbi:PTS glucose transporter subunit IIA [Paenibacillus sp. FSL K6-3166]|uniref:PTS glucose transporter subunit IIA n=1 Tax=unclassified Paenibacillus TaxID=185978 RepID=UPI000BD59831|nr:PTS glucose transporter subunit IIA [Paenibacillus sp. VTT E-133291]OZQ91147.1 hypothetical protein CA598_12315 [Paenibacillus sp. VTT E-133291]
MYITSNEGAEILIRVGINTVKFKGQYFTNNVKGGGVKIKETLYSRDSCVFCLLFLCLTGGLSTNY